MPETNVSKQTSGLKELFASFLTEPTRVGLREVLQSHLGETKYLDFKMAWEVPSRTARHVLGLANSQGGGLIIGVAQKADNGFDLIGLHRLEDKAEVTNAIQKYLPSKVNFEIYDFSYEESDYGILKGKRFQVLLVQDSPKYVPFVSTTEGEGIRKNAIYIRREGGTNEANYDELQEVINRRIETQYSSKTEQQLEKALSELKILYSSIPRYLDGDEVDYEASLYLVNNPQFPKESYERFIRKMIQRKKQQIAEIASVQRAGKPR
jgi:predicted HTH transcriptional regulator